MDGDGEGRDEGQSTLRLARRQADRGRAAPVGRARAMVLSSLSEGGANVMSEAVVRAFRYWPRASMARSACSAGIIRAIFRSATRRRWRDCCAGSRPSPEFLARCVAR